jgi:hypothetical protein
LAGAIFAGLDLAGELKSPTTFLRTFILDVESAAMLAAGGIGDIKYQWGRVSRCGRGQLSSFFRY